MPEPANKPTRYAMGTKISVNYAFVLTWKKYSPCLIGEYFSMLVRKFSFTREVTSNVVNIFHVFFYFVFFFCNLVKIFCCCCCGFSLVLLNASESIS